MFYRVKDDVGVDLRDSGWPIYADIIVGGSSVALTDYELRCLISACSEALKERARLEYKYHEEQLEQSRKNIRSSGGQ
jgi:cell division protein FtsL